MSCNSAKPETSFFDFKDLSKNKIIDNIIATFNNLRNR